MELVALLSSGKGTWAQVSGLIKHGEWDKIIVIGGDFAKEFKADKKFEFIKINQDSKLLELKKEIVEKLRGKINDTEAELSIASGDGKEHMALLEAVMELGLNFRLVTVKNNQLQVLGMER